MSVHGSELVAPTDSSTLWRTVHKATPFIKAWQVIAVLVTIGIISQAELLAEIFQEFRDEIWLIALVIFGLLIVLFLISTIYSWLAWKRIRYAVTDDAVYYHKGIIFRSQRHARLNRIQGVDVNRPLLGRLVGLSSVAIESAGGANSRVTIEFLKDEIAEALRAEVLARAAGLKAVAEGDGAHVPVFAKAPERQIFELPPMMQMRSIVRSLAFIILALFIVGFIVLAIVLQQIAIFFGILPILLAMIPFYWGEFAGNFNHRLAISPDGLRMRAGLLSTRSQTIPPRRVQAIKLTQPFLWRSKDWWRIEINVAGYGPATNTSGGGMRVGAMVLPVAPRDVALHALWIMIPDLGLDEGDASKDVLEGGLTGKQGEGGFLHSPRSARFVDWISWKRNGALATRTVLLLRSGRITRELVVVPHERTQSLSIRQGPLQRLMKVATFVAHSVIGPVNARAKHLDEWETLKLLEDQAARARVQRTREGPEQWAKRVGMEA